MPSKRHLLWPTVTALIAAFILLTALPSGAKQWAPGFLQSPRIHLGLDLAGGTQLDFRISEQEMRDQITQLQQETEAAKRRGDNAQVAILQQQRTSIEQQQQTVVESIRTVLERRINALGVSEAVITPSYVGSEKHLLVECPGVVDIQECIATVGKTIKLEFKEQYTEVTEEHERSVRERVVAALERIAEGETLATVGQDLGDDLGMAYEPAGRYFRDLLPEGLGDLWARPPSDRVYEREATVTVQGQTPDGEPAEQEVPGIFLVQVVGGRTQTGRLITDGSEMLDILAGDEPNVTAHHFENQLVDNAIAREVRGVLNTMQPGQLQVAPMVDSSARIVFLESKREGGEQMSASHILIAYKDATSADESVTRSREEAQEFISELKSRLEAGERFEFLAKTYSDGPSGKRNGALGTFTRDAMVPAFSQSAFSLKPGEVSDIVETPFGYHLIRADTRPETKPSTATFHEVRLSGENAVNRAQELIGRLQRGDIRRTEEVAHLRTLFFSLLPTGWKDTPLDGKHFRSATVTLDPVSNIPVVQITFDDEGALLFQELTARNVGDPIAIFVGGELVSAPTVQTEIAGGIAIITGMRNFEEAKQLATDLNTGAIPAPIYLSGQRTVEATLGARALETSLKAALIGIVLLMVYMGLMYRLLGLLADIALLIYAVIFLALLKLPLFLFSSNYIVLTLAGMAGIILSIGMAVDANVLIFERLREELRKGKMLSTAIETGFKRAWPSIRDGNVSTLITCFILFTVGTSIVRGFAITLGMGVLLSMFSAIVVTRFFMRRIAETKFAEQTTLFGVKEGGIVPSP